MQIQTRFGRVGGQARRFAGAGQRVPVVAHAAGVEQQRVVGIRLVDRSALGYGHHATAPIRREEPAVAQQARRAGGGTRAHRPLHGLQGVESRPAQTRQRTDVEIPPCPPGQGRQTRVLVEDFRLVGKAEAGVTQALAHFAQCPPVRPRLSRRRQKRPLARQPPLAVGHRAAFLAPGQRRQQHVRQRRGVGMAHAVADNDQFTAGERGPEAVRFRQADQRIGAHDPHRPHLPGLDGAKQVDGLVARRVGNRPAAPELRHLRAVVRIRQIQMAGQRIGQTPHLAPAHGVRLAGERQRPHAGPADAAGGQVAVDDGVDLVGAGRGLVDALRVDGDRLVGGREPVEQRLHVGRIEPARGGDRGHIWRIRTRRSQGSIEAVHMAPRRSPDPPRRHRPAPPAGR